MIAAARRNTSASWTRSAIVRARELDSASQAREVLRAVDRDDRRRLAFHPSEARVGRRLRVEVQDVERSALDVRRAIRRAASRPTFSSSRQRRRSTFAARPRLGASGRLNARRAARSARAQVAAQIDVHGLDAGKLRPRRVRARPTVRCPRIPELTNSARVEHDRSGTRLPRRRSSRCRRAPGDHRRATAIG